MEKISSVQLILCGSEVIRMSNTSSNSLMRAVGGLFAKQWGGSGTGQYFADNYFADIISPTMDPVTVPPILPNVYREAYLLECENRPMIVYNNRTVIVMPSRAGVGKNTKALFEEFVASSAFEWNRYVELKRSFFIIEKSQIWPHFFGCNCSIGIKKASCKHSVMVMKKEGLCQYPRDALAEVLGQKRKRGRPSQS
uniref:SWIM-type domain-containing protein n=1 Tax=Ditylenchus dipsaci TaxID=166011 RepID=A0A915DSW9_9BILA